MYTCMVFFLDPILEQNSLKLFANVPHQPHLAQKVQAEHLLLFRKVVWIMEQLFLLQDADFNKTQFCSKKKIKALYSLTVVIIHKFLEKHRSEMTFFLQCKVKWSGFFFSSFTPNKDGRHKRSCFVQWRLEMAYKTSYAWIFFSFY